MQERTELDQARSVERSIHAMFATQLATRGGRAVTLAELRTMAREHLDGLIVKGEADPALDVDVDLDDRDPTLLHIVVGSSRVDAA